MINLVKKQKSFAGVWNGFYSYNNDPEFARDYQVPFRMEIQENSFGKITGTVQDDATKGGAETPGTITGYITKGAINFEMVMPELSLVDSHGNVVNDPASSYVIQYKGNYNYTKDSFSGTWLIEGGVVGTGKNAYTVEDTTGTWGMEREDGKSVSR
jgi:hypothetical protein